MAGIGHLFSSGKADAADTSIIRAGNWNADHVIDDAAIGFEGMVNAAYFRAWDSPTGALGQTYSRADNAASAASQALLTSGTLWLQAVPLVKNDVITSVSFLSGTTALAAGTHQFFGIYSSARALLKTSVDDTSTAWGTNTIKTLALATTYTVATTGLHYLGILVVASTVPTLRGQPVVNANTINAIPPILGGATSDTGQSALPANAGSITATNVGFPYGWVS